MSDLIANNINITKSAGIIILFIFSIPFATPKYTIPRVIMIAIKLKTTVLLLPAKESKYVLISISLIFPVNSY
ncbi:hypothetical protein GCM10008916_27640 [Clostridium nitritogenes]|uniref:Uncharacterized protein n=1 Tax=Clostridium nitritogenes TaxID=83340 RepID=A0ABN1LUI8_9CLOT